MNYTQRIATAIMVAVVGLVVHVGANAQTLTLDNVAPIQLTTSTSINAVSIDINTGNVTIKSSAGDLTQCTGSTTTPVITSFTASAASVPPSTAFSLSWTSANTTSCSGQMGTGTTWASLGTLGTTGTQQLTAPATLGSITFQLTCTNGSQNVTSQTTINVETSTGGSCQPPTGTTGSTSQWTSTFGSAWPSFNGVRRQPLTPNSWVAVQFIATASATQFGTFSSSHYPNDGDGQGQVSIGTSAGCFNQSQLGANCLSPVSDLPGVSWSNQSSNFICKLTPGATYYLSIWFPNCPSGSCGRDFGNIQQLLQSGGSLR
jgi:hypothetical protein